MSFIKLTSEDKKILEQFPKYDDKPDHWVGSREYWESVFETETNRNPELHKAFGELHTKLVNEVIQFCKEHDLDVDEFHLSADGLLGSKQYGQWTCFTDSSMSMYVRKEGKDGFEYTDRENPFLYRI